VAAVKGHAGHYDFGIVLSGVVLSVVVGLLTDLVVAFAAGKFEA
jgi:hypothetical protein